MSALTFNTDSLITHMNSNIFIFFYLGPVCRYSERWAAVAPPLTRALSSEYLQTEMGGHI